jgi:hypothetical protein
MFPFWTGSDIMNFLPIFIALCILGIVGRLAILFFCWLVFDHLIPWLNKGSDKNENRDEEAA